jgi:threonine dehydratase
MRGNWKRNGGCSSCRPSITAGHGRPGTVGLEILEALPDAETLLVPIGGGG